MADGAATQLAISHLMGRVAELGCEVDGWRKEAVRKANQVSEFVETIGVLERDVAAHEANAKNYIARIETLEKALRDSKQFLEIASQALREFASSLSAPQGPLETK